MECSFRNPDWWLNNMWFISRKRTSLLYKNFRRVYLDTMISLLVYDFLDYISPFLVQCNHFSDLSWVGYSPSHIFVKFLANTAGYIWTSLAPILFAPEDFLGFNILTSFSFGNSYSFTGVRKNILFPGLKRICYILSRNSALTVGYVSIFFRNQYSLHQKYFFHVKFPIT